MDLRFLQVFVESLQTTGQIVMLNWTAVELWRGPCFKKSTMSERDYYFTLVMLIFANSIY